MPASRCAAVVHESFRASGVPAQSESLKVSSGSVQPETLTSGFPVMDVGQQTSLSPGFSRTQPVATASFACWSVSQSSFRGLPDCDAQSFSVSEPSFCRQSTVAEEEEPVLDSEEQANASDDTTPAAMTR